MNDKRIAIVIGAGGPVGYAYGVGVLAGLETSGCDGRDVDLIIGTSAGAQIAAVMRAGVAASDLKARIERKPIRPAATKILANETRPDHDETDRVRAWRPSSTRRLKQSLRRPLRLQLGTLGAAVLPLGRISLKSQTEGYRAIFGNAWADRPLWIPAVDLDSGERVVFGRDRHQETDVGTAVAASGAVPTVNMPVEINGRRYIDGAIYSATNLDAISGRQADLAIVISPMSGKRRAGLNWRNRLWRQIFSRALQREVDHVNELAVSTIVFEPTQQDVAVMGPRMFDSNVMAAVADVAHDTTVTRIDASRHEFSFVGK